MSITNEDFQRDLNQLVKANIRNLSDLVVFATHSRYRNINGPGREWSVRETARWLLDNPEWIDLIKTHLRLGNKDVLLELPEPELGSKEGG